MGYTAHDTIGLLKSKLVERVLSRNDPVNWSSRSCDLKPLDWDYVQTLVYANKVTTLEKLRVNIALKTDCVIVERCEQVIKTWLQRIDRVPFINVFIVLQVSKIFFENIYNGLRFILKNVVKSLLENPLFMV